MGDPHVCLSITSGALLGDWDTSRGAAMRCHHETDEVLVWEALVSLPWQV